MYGFNKPCFFVKLQTKKEGSHCLSFFCLELFRTIVHFQQDGFTTGTIVSPCDSWQVTHTPILPRTIVHFWTNSRLTSPILQLPNNCTVQQPRLRPDPAPDPEQFNPITTRIQEKARTIPRAFAYHV
jgi:hypothetical protein